jgi:hypothetical protein
LEEAVSDRLHPRKVSYKVAGLYFYPNSVPAERLVLISQSTQGIRTGCKFLSSSFYLPGVPLERTEKTKVQFVVHPKKQHKSASVQKEVPIFCAVSVDFSFS